MYGSEDPLWTPRMSRHFKVRFVRSKLLQVSYYKYHSVLKMAVGQSIITVVF